MRIVNLCRDACDFRCCPPAFPCLADPARRTSLGLKAALVILHLVYVGVLFLFDDHLVEKTKHEPWYTALYLLLFGATLVQYFVTAGSSPGYVLDAMRAMNERRKPSIIPK
uniref:Protein S-acyltransferase 10 n=1 Tax=Rhizophora mucronata TaxID=61149 RepID=A0A2P2KVR1_RHIMU